jgi:hypothetical protein
MTLEAAFKDLTAKWVRLAEELEHGLLWSVTETKPAEEHALATDYLDTATDMIAAAREGLYACQTAFTGEFNMGQAGKVLLRCQEQYNAIVEMFDSKMASYTRIRRLKRFGREKRGAWRDWAAHVSKAVERCRHPLDDLNRAIFHSWQELADRIGMSAISVHTTSVGQKITVHRSEEKVESAI